MTIIYLLFFTVMVVVSYSPCSSANAFEMLKVEDEKWHHKKWSGMMKRKNERCLVVFYQTHSLGEEYTARESQGNCWRKLRRTTPCRIWRHFASADIQCKGNPSFSSSMIFSPSFFNIVYLLLFNGILVVSYSPCNRANAFEMHFGSAVIQCKGNPSFSSSKFWIHTFDVWPWRSVKLLLQICC